MRLLPIFAMSALLFSGAVFAHGNGKSLELDITNATKQNASLAGVDPENRRVHGYIIRRGILDIPPGQTSTWVFYQFFGGGVTGKGIEGKVEYQWKGEDGANHSCLIHYHQTGRFFSAGVNETTVTGDCKTYNDPTKPSSLWDLTGESQITLGIKE